MLNKPEVSIIMNCLNCERDLPAALESVGRQTFSNWEIIFWDNCSTDKSPSIARAFENKLRYFRGAATIPLGAARNQAISEARGKYIAFLDCDDLWEPEKLEKQLTLFKNNPKVGLVATDTKIYTGGKIGGRIFAKSRPAKGMVFNQLMTRQWISMSSAMLSKKALDSVKKDGKWFDERLELCEEADLFYRIAHDWELDYVDEPLTIWRVHGNNATILQFDKFAEETELILNKHREIYPGYDQTHKEIIELLNARMAFQKAVSLWKNGDGPLSRKLIQPYLQKGRKYQLFWLASFLPGASFRFLARIYFSMPGKFF